MDSLHLAIALGPVAVYLLLAGAISFSSRPILTTGTRDTAALCVAISGFVVAGPMELFMPAEAVGRLGGFVWILLLILYGLFITLVLLMLRPRLVIYNMTAEQLRPILAEMISWLDSEARWAGESLVMPQLGVALHIESFSIVRNVQLVASGPQQSHEGWRKLEKTLGQALRETSGAGNPYGYSLIVLSLLIVGLITFWILTDGPAVQQALEDMLMFRLE